MTKEFKHGAVTITLGATSGRFHAERDGLKYEAGSLAGIKKKLDAKPAIEPFDALDVFGGYDDPRKVRVIGIVKKQGRTYNWQSDNWKLDDGSERRHVYIDTDEVRLLLDQRKMMVERHEAVRKKLAEELEALDAKLQPHDRKPPKRK